MNILIGKMYPFWALVCGCVIAQGVKPFIWLIFHHEWKPWLIFSSGGMPSSHSSSVAALSLAVGLDTNFSSTLFAVTLCFSVIICFDAANVRYYAGQNISLTKKLIDDLKELNTLTFDDPIYSKKLKEVLGHTYFEVIAGIIVGLGVSYLLYMIRG